MPDAVNIIKKKAGETLNVSMAFSNWLNGETISSITSVTATACSDGSASAVTIGTSAISSTNVTFSVAGGTAGIRYMIRVTIVTSGSQILIGEGILVVT